MPVIRYEDLKTKRNVTNMPIPTGTKNLGYYLDDAAEDLENPLAEQLRKLKKAYEDVEDPSILKDEESEKVKNALVFLSGLKEFLHKTDKNGVTNYQKICEVLDRRDDDKINKTSARDFSDLLKERDEYYETGLGIDLLNEKMEENTGNRKEEDEQEEPEVFVIDNEGLNSAEDKAPEEPEILVIDNEDQNSAEDKPPVEEIRTAAQHIEVIRDGAFPRKKHMERLNANEREAYFNSFAKILAARELANAKIGDRTNLDASSFAESKMRIRAAQIKDDPHFETFMQELKEHPEKMQAAVDAACKRPGHGGGLEKMFRKHILTLPAGEMSNHNNMKHFMPTYKARIEELKAQAAMRVKEGDNPASEMAEIVTLRNMARAVRDQRGAESLDKPVGTDEYGLLGEETNSLAASDVMLDAIQHQEIRDALKKGHGGLLTERLRTLALNDETLDRETKKRLFANTASRHIVTMRKDAENLKAELDQAIERKQDPQSDKMKDLKQRCQKMIGEYMILDDATRDPKTHAVSDDYSIKDVPWLRVNHMREQGPEVFPEFQNMIKDFTLQELSGMLGAMATNTQNNAMSYMVDTVGAKQAQAHQPANAGRQEAQPDGPQAGM